jgi:hypothetical protein
MFIPVGYGCATGDFEAVFPGIGIDWDEYTGMTE